VTARAAVIVLLAVGLAAAASAATLDDQVHAIAGELMCPVCAGQTVAESSSALAGQMREIIRTRLRQGQTRQEIIAYFVAELGEGVLATPPRHGRGLWLWLAPPAALAIGLLVLGRTIQRSRSTRRTPPPATADEAERIRRELRALD
jgi:cytochrome c-type biogenesis protein CcmH